jgi:hypothetical protein
MRRPIPTVLNLQDVKNLIDCKAQLDAVINSLAACNWAGGKASIAALGIVDRFVCDLYNRVEPHWLAYLNRASAGAPAPSPSDPCPQVSGGSPGASVHPDEAK